MYPIAIVRGLVRHFAELAGYEGEPVFVTTQAEVFERIRRRRRYDAPTNEDEDAGSTLVGPPPVVWINPDALVMGRLAKTCAHEALHVAHPRLSHGPAFDRAVRRLLSGLEP